MTIQTAPTHAPDGGSANDEATAIRYDGFISYSHKGEREVARSLEKTLWTFGRKWYQLRGVRTYRDESNLAAEPDLWPAIDSAVRRSACLILLASPDSARSAWVPREVSAIIECRGLNALCVVQTSGVLPWTDNITPQEMLQRPDAALSREVWELLATAGVHPVVVDLRPFRNLGERRRVRDPEYLSRTAMIAAKVLARDKEVIWGEYHRSERNRNAFLGGLSLLLVGLLTILGVSFRSTLQRTRDARLSFSNALALQARSDFEEHPQRALLLASEALQIAEEEGQTFGTAAEAFLRYGLSRIGGMPLSLHRANLAAVELSPDGRWIASAGRQVVVSDLSAVDPAATSRVLCTEAVPPSQLAFSRDSTWLAALSNDHLRLWRFSKIDGRFSDASSTFPVSAGESNRLDFTADNQWAIVRSGKQANDLELIDLRHADGKATSGLVGPYQLSPNGRWILTVAQDTPTLWDLHSADPTARPIKLGVPADHFEARFSDDGHWLLTSSPNDVRVWALVTSTGPKVVRVLPAPKTTFFQAAFSPDSQWLMTTVGDGANLEDFATGTISVFLWRLQHSTGKVTLGRSQPVKARLSLALTFAADSRWLVVSGQNGNSNSYTSFFLWSLNGATPTPRPLAGPVGRQFVSTELSPSGRWLLISSGSDARLWDLNGDDAAERYERLSDVPDEWNQFYEFSADSQQLVYHSSRGMIVWSLNDGEPSAETVSLPPLGTYRVEVSPDSMWIAVADERTVLLWHRSQDSDSEAPQRLIGLEGRVMDTLVDTNGRWLVAVGSTDLRIWDLRNLLSNQQYPIVTGTNDTSVVSPDRQWIAALSRDGARVSITSLVAKRPLNDSHVIIDQQSGQGTPVFSLDSRRVLTCTKDASQLWELDGKNPPKRVAEWSAERLAGFGPLQCSAAFSPDLRWVAIGGEVGSGSLWDVAALPRPRETKLKDVYSLASGHFTPDSRWFVVEGLGNYVLISLVGPDPVSRILPGLERSPYRRSQLTTDGRWLVVRGRHAAMLWDLQSGPQPVRTVLPGYQDETNDDVDDLAVTSDSRWLVTRHAVSGGIEWWLWDLKSSNVGIAVKLPVQTGFLRLVKLSADGRWLLTSAGNGAWLWDLWRLSPSSKPYDLQVRDNTTFFPTFSPDGRWLLTTNNSGSLFWDLAKMNANAQPRVFPGSTGMAHTFSDDGRWLVTSGPTMVLWDLHARDPLASSMPIDVDQRDFLEHPSMAFTHANHWLLKVGDLGVSRWTLRSQELLELAEKMCGRNLSASESTRYFPQEAYHRTFVRLPVPVGLDEEPEVSPLAAPFAASSRDK